MTPFGKCFNHCCCLLMKFTNFVSLYFPAIFCTSVHDFSPCRACKMNIWQSVVFYCFKYHGDTVQWITNGACPGQTQLWKLFATLLLMRFDYNMTDIVRVSSNFCPSSLVNYAIFFVIFLFIIVNSIHLTGDNWVTEFPDHLQPQILH